MPHLFIQCRKWGKILPESNTLHCVRCYVYGYCGSWRYPLSRTAWFPWRTVVKCLRHTLLTLFVPKQQKGWKWMDQDVHFLRAWSATLHTRLPYSSSSPSYLSLWSMWVDGIMRPSCMTVTSLPFPDLRSPILKTIQFRLHTMEPSHISLPPSPAGTWATGAGRSPQHWM